MYIIERLHKDFPEHESEINNFRMFIERYHNKDWLYKIFDDQKIFYKYIDEAYKIGPGNPGYTRNMAYFEKELNYDKDFLQFFIQDMFNDMTDYSNKSALELRNIIDKQYKEYNNGKK